MKILSVIVGAITLCALCVGAPKALAYSTNMGASVVIGQPDFTSNAANRGGAVAANTLSSPAGVAYFEGKLIVSDSFNNRVVIFNQVPTASNAVPDVVIGQFNFTSNAANQGVAAGANTLSSPRGVLVVSGKLFIADRSNNRVLVFNQLPTANNASADMVIGQSSFTDSAQGLGADRMLNPTGIDFEKSSGKLLILDSNNRRVLLYNAIPASDGVSADVVVGQPDFQTRGYGCSSSQYTGYASSARFIDGKLLVTDKTRVLIYNAVPTANGASADAVLGQQDFTSCAANAGGQPDARTFSFANGTAYDGSRLFISDGGNSRTLVFDGIPTQNGTPAIKVIGQADFTSVAANQGGGAAANTLNFPNYTGGFGLASFGNRLAITDRENSRVLIYENPLPSVSGLTAAFDAERKLALSWSFGDGDLGDTQKALQVQLDTDPAFSSPNLVSGVPLVRVEATYRHADLLNSGTWYARVRLQDSQGDWGEYSGPVSATLSEPLSPPTPTASQAPQAQGAVLSTIGGKVLGTGLTTVDRRPEIAGSAPAGSKITVTIHSDPVACATVAAGDGRWSCRPDRDVALGDHTVFIDATTSDGTALPQVRYSFSVVDGLADTGANTAIPFALGILLLLGSVMSLRRQARAEGR